MKAFVLAALFFATANAFAAVEVDATPELVAQFPDAIKCTSRGLSSAVKEFTITQLNTVRPASTLPDQGLVDPTSTFVSDVSRLPAISMTFSNECDNGYTVSFDVESLVKLKAGTVKSIIGGIGYADFELYEISEGFVGEEKLALTCTL